MAAGTNDFTKRVALRRLNRLPRFDTGLSRFENFTPIAAG